MVNSNNPFENLGANLRNDLYEADLGVFSNLNNKIIDLADVKNPEKIIDMGCRTGISTTTLQKRFPNADIYAIDPNKSSRDV